MVGSAVARRQYKFVLAAGWQAGGGRLEAGGRRLQADMVAARFEAPSAMQDDQHAKAWPRSSQQPAACSLRLPPSASSLQPPASSLPRQLDHVARAFRSNVTGEDDDFARARGTVDQTTQFAPLRTAHIPQGPMLLPPDGDQQLADQEGGLIAQRLTFDTHLAGRGTMSRSACGAMRRAHRGRVVPGGPSRPVAARLRRPAGCSRVPRRAAIGAGYDCG